MCIIQPTEGLERTNRQRKVEWPLSECFSSGIPFPLILDLPGCQPFWLRLESKPLALRPSYHTTGFSRLEIAGCGIWPNILWKIINISYCFFPLWRALTDTHFSTFSPINLSIVNIRQCLQCRVPTYSLHGFILGRCLKNSLSMNLIWLLYPGTL